MSTIADFLFRHLFSTPSHHHNPTTTTTFLHMLPPTKHGREHRRAQRWEKGGCTRYARYIFFLFSISYVLPLPAQPSLSWGIPHLPNYATPSCRTRKTRHLQRVFRFRRLFFVQTRKTRTRSHFSCLVGILPPPPPPVAANAPYLSPLPLSTCQI